MSSDLLKHSVNQYLEELPQPVQTRLYESPATCLAIYRLLPELAKYFMMSMVFNENFILLRDLDRWVKPNGKIQFQEAIKSLKSLHLIIPKKNDTGALMIGLNPTFRESFKNALTGGEVRNSFGIVIENNSISMDILNEYSSSKWETILHFMVGTPIAKIPSANVLNLLKSSGLMEETETTAEFKITNEGFQFLLQEANAQIWTLLLQYLKMAESFQMDPVDILNFIFMLGSLEVGKAYSTKELSDTQKNMLKDMRDYGLIFQKNSEASVFYPTNLSIVLTSDNKNAVRSAAGALDSVVQKNKDDSGNVDANTMLNDEVGLQGQKTPEGAVIVETNFKLYSYSNSPLQIAILSLFLHLKTRFANMVTGQITRESIRTALTNGITAEQIIAYLETHAHPQMRRLAEENLMKKLELDPNSKDTLQILPPTVVDQIRLWQLELDRVICYDGSLYSDFESSTEYNLLSKYAQDIGVLLWRDDKKRKFFVSKEGNSQVLDYAKRKLNKK
ncbi:RNA polymerase II transcription factor B 52 kDa subunit [Maudiozyma exigua]|uniref:RNA polymerase II transcription factor B subunit 2 n=1 Tax=Maudiozyma exigua TaxID=34358 RepID=A0A9P7B3P2_MAUEX|nr:RNA polymerase II transcription factor B 52 kDa subunit [Kazachstania exigua]